MSTELEEKPVIAVPEAVGSDEGNAEDSAPKTLRDELKDNLKAIKERHNDTGDEKPASQAKAKDKSVKNSAERNESGRFVPKPVSAGPNEAAKPAQVPSPALAPVITPAIAAPEAWRADLKAKWGALPPEVQTEIARRESEMEKKLSTMDEERHFARKIKDVVTPYMPIIQAEGGTAEGAVKDLLNSAYILRTGTPQQKLNLIVNTARQFGVDLKNIAQISSQPQQVDHVAIAQEAARTEVNNYKQQQEAAQIQSVITAFASDPANVHYEKVKPVMAALLSAGTAKDMKDAYDRACYADPEIRTSLQAEKSKAEEAERVAQKKAKAEAARYAASSVRGSSPLNGADISKAPKRGLREELQANFRAATEH